MGINELKAKVKADKAFAENFKSVQTPEEAVETAKKLGYDISLKDLELTEEELKAVAGGKKIGVYEDDIIVRPSSGVIVDWS